MNDNSGVVRTTAQDKSKPAKRRSLSSIQPISSDNKVLTRSMATVKRSDKDKIKDKNLKNERAIKWMTQKDSIETDVKYWKTLAKERQKALEITLKENKTLAEENEKLTEELDEAKHSIEILTQENNHFRELAEEGARLKELLDEVIAEQS